MNTIGSLVGAIAGVLGLLVGTTIVLLALANDPIPATITLLGIVLLGRRVWDRIRKIEEEYVEAHMSRATDPEVAKPLTPVMPESQSRSVFLPPLVETPDFPEDYAGSALDG